MRLLLAGLVLMMLAYATNKDSFKEIWKDKSSLLHILLFAVLGLFINQYAYLAAIHETNAGTATVLQYLCPVGVLAYTCVKDRVAPTVAQVCSMILAIGGTFLIATHGQVNQLSMTPKGLFLGVFSAFTYALYILLPIGLIKKWGSMLVIGIGMTIAGILLLPFSGIFQHQWQVRSDILLALVGIIVIGTIFAYTVFLKGTSLVGPVKSSLLASIEPISAVFFAFVIMNERFYLLDFVGMGMILLAVLLISVKDLILEKKKGFL